MKRILTLLFIAFATSAAAKAHSPFTLVSSEKKTIKAADVVAIEKGQTPGARSGTQLAFTQSDLRLVIFTGPEDDMLSYRIQGMRNPTLVVPAGVTMRILFVNVDGEMRHDVRFAHMQPPFDVAPAIDESAGSTRLTAKAEDGAIQAEEIVIKANSNGQYVYFCSVRTHAQGGMWGNIAVGVQPGADVKPPEKTEHVHSADEDHDHPNAKPATSPPPSGHDGHVMPKATPTPSGHEGHTMPKATPTPSAHDGHATPAASPTPHAHGGDAMDHSKSMSSTVDINDPMNREGSGTAWLPDSTPMHAYTRMYKDGGMLMLMGSAFLRYTQVGSTRDISASGKGGRARVDAPNMFMAMYSRPLSSKSQLGLRVMASLDPVTQRGYGYPLLYQSGELFKGEPIHDRQHPHDFISELAASYSYKTAENQSFFIYGGIVGEPALGPAMFLHRPSGANNPDAPIGHHWQDASHITWGVITGGYNFGKFKVEASAFNGTEPDENRWAFDKPKLDSFSGRFSFNPTKDLSLQFSHGYLKKPERAEPDLDHMHRTTASAIYNKNFSETKNWASSFVWGQNYKEGAATNSFLFESDYSFGKNAVFGRIERVQKDGHELVLDHDDPIHNNVFWVGAYSIGYVRDIIQNKGIDVGLGGMATFNSNPAALVPYYGGTKHSGFQFFLRFRPSKMKH